MNTFEIKKGPERSTRVTVVVLKPLQHEYGPYRKVTVRFYKIYEELRRIENSRRVQEGEPYFERDT